MRCAHGRELGLRLCGVGGLPAAPRAACGGANARAPAQQENAECLMVRTPRNCFGPAASIQALCPLLYLPARKSPISSHAATVRVHWPSSLSRGRGRARGHGRDRRRDPGAHVQRFAALSSMQAVRLMNQGALVLDLRAKESFDAGHIGDARNVPAAELEDRSRHAEEMARQDRDYLLRQRRERRRRRAHAGEARLHQGIQSRRRLERAGSRTTCRLTKNDERTDEGRARNEPARRSSCTCPAGVRTVERARGLLIEERHRVSARSTSMTIRSCARR